MANKYRHLTPEQVAAQAAAEEYYRQLEAEVERSLSSIHTNTWQSYWENEEREARQWEHCSRMPRLHLTHLKLRLSHKALRRLRRKV